MRDQCLLADLGSPSDVADAIVFLCSDRVRFITGQLLCVDGGVSAHVPHLAGVRGSEVRSSPRLAAESA